MSDDIDDRLSRRFDSGQSDAPDDASDDARNTTSSGTSQKTQNVKKEWNVRSFYLDDELDEDLITAFKRLDLELTQSDAEINLRKTRHFYPLIVTLGLEQLEDMDDSEIIDHLQQIKDN